MDWFGSPTAVTAWPSPKSREKSTSWACEVSWNSSSSTTLYRWRSICAATGISLATRAARATRSPKSSAPRARFASA